MNAHCERVIRTLRNEVCDHILILNEAHARLILAEYQRHYNQHRPHRARQRRPPEFHHQHERAHEANARTLLRTHVLDGLIDEYRYAARHAAMTFRAVQVSASQARVGRVGADTTVAAAAAPGCVSGVTRHPRRRRCLGASSRNPLRSGG
nr:transposase [Saccharopolyspora elongata]